MDSLLNIKQIPRIEPERGFLVVPPFSFDSTAIPHLVGQGVLEVQTFSLKSPIPRQSSEFTLALRIPREDYPGYYKRLLLWNDPLLDYDTYNGDSIWEGSYLEIWGRVVGPVISSKSLLIPTMNYGLRACPDEEIGTTDLNLDIHPVIEPIKEIPTGECNPLCFPIC